MVEEKKITASTSPRVSGKRSRAVSMSEFQVERDEAMVSQAKNNAFAVLLDCIQATGDGSVPLTADVENLMNETAAALGIKVNLLSNHPRQKFKLGPTSDAIGSSCASSNSSATPKRRSPRKSGTSRADWGDEHNDLCEVCDKDGDLLCCDTCSLVYHVQCVRPSIEAIPEGDWVCAYCVMDNEAGNSTDESCNSTDENKSGSEERSLAADSIRTMKLLHALNMSQKEVNDISGNILLKGPFELDKSLNVFKSDSRFIVKRLDSTAGSGQSSYIELSRFWTLEEALFEVRRLSIELNERHNNLSTSDLSESDKVNTVDNLLKGWVVDSAARKSMHSFRGCVPQKKKLKIQLSDNGIEKTASTRDDDVASDLWCKACIDDPEVVYCSFCGCRHCFGKHDHDLLVTCDYCEEKYHTYCVTPPLVEMPRDTWYCQHCHLVDQNNTVEQLGIKKVADTERSGGGDVGSRTSKRSKAGVGYNPHAFSNSQEIPSKNNYLQQDHLNDLPSGRPPIPSSSSSTFGGKSVKGRRGDGKSGGGSKKSSKGQHRSMSDEVGIVNSVHEVANVSGLVGDTNGLPFDKKINELLPPVIPEFLPMKLGKVIDVIESVSSHTLLPKEIYLLNQFHTWAPEDERNVVALRLSEMKSRIINRISELNPAVDIESLIVKNS